MKAVLKAFWPTVCKYRWSFSTMVFFMVMMMPIKAIYPFLLRNLLDGLIAKSSSDVWETFCLIVGLYIASNLISAGFDTATTLFETRSMRDIDQRSFYAIQAQSMRFFENSFAGSLVACAKRFCSAFEDLVDAFVYQLGRCIVMVVITLGVFIWERPLFALAFSAWLLVFCCISYWFAKARISWTIEAAAKDSIVVGNFADSFANHTAVKSFGKERDEQRRFDDVSEDCYQHRIKAWMFRKSLFRIQGVISGIFELLVIYMLVQGWRNGTISVGDFVFFQTYILLLMAQVEGIGASFHRIFRCLAESREMAEIYAEQSEVRDSANARPLNVEEGAIEFHSVSFRYLDNDKNGKRNRIENFSLRVAPGETIAFVGHSGAGKSTLVKLLLRYYDLNSGYIRIDGQDIATVTQLSLRQQIAVVPQEPCLFHRSIRDNIAFARPDASENEIISAAKSAHAWGFISELPQGFDTLVGERGVKLSGGERQRIALARAFLADAQILVLDEATSSLDSLTEHDIQEATKDLLQGRTCFIIAHRLSTIRRANKIIVMEKGSIVEQGTHKELLHRKGVYANLWSHQSDSYTV